MIDEQMRAIAEAATPGPWHTSRQDGAPCDHIVDFGPPPKAPYIMLYPAKGVLHTDGSIDERNATARYIATFDPPTVLDLLDRLAKAEAGRQAVAKVRDGYASQAKFADPDCAVHFREFVRRIDAALATPDGEAK